MGVDHRAPAARLSCIRYRSNIFISQTSHFRHPTRANLFQCRVLSAPLPVMGIPDRFCAGHKHHPPRVRRRSVCTRVFLSLRRNLEPAVWRTNSTAISRLPSATLANQSTRSSLLADRFEEERSFRSRPVCGWCHQQKDISTGIYDDGEWMCGDCVSGYAT